MNRIEMMKKLAMKNNAKMVMFIFDGLGGLPDPATGRTELEEAATPNLDALAKKSICGLSVPIATGITPGSGPAHLSLFGYDPLEFDIGRGILSALGIDFPVGKNDVAARINFCTIDDKGIITDRRAGRLSTDKNIEIAKKIVEKVKVPGVEIFFCTEKEHRAAMIIRGEGLSDRISDTDPQITGVEVPLCHPLDDTAEAKYTAEVVNKIVAEIKELIKEDHPANMVLTRGFAKHPAVETMNDIYQLKSAAIAVYPMYRGLAKLVGMDVLPAPKDVPGEFDQLEEVYKDYDFFFFHVKGTDSRGEDGDYAGKVKVIEETDKLIPRLMALDPDVVVVTGDHSTPSQLKAHSWHPVPFLLYSKHNRPDHIEHFGETECGKGLLGTFPALDTMSLMMANALKLNKHGA
ncbi:MAG: 2,3-bisphosphoglycerate-independent phosphoglycerate mutase [Firmicutes bacterium]|nr:2,3-bisphosphoglycerate-independent phosphoglycerate mutase [Bacillota bacterium]